MEAMMTDVYMMTAPTQTKLFNFGDDILITLKVCGALLDIMIDH
jgi:hypothetical protein